MDGADLMSALQASLEEVKKRTGAGPKRRARRRRHRQPPEKAFGPVAAGPPVRRVDAAGRPLSGLRATASAFASALRPPVPPDRLSRPRAPGGVRRRHRELA